jgi:hypothetical protein
MVWAEASCALARMARPGNSNSVLGLMDGFIGEYRWGGFAATRNLLSLPPPSS